MTVWPSGLRRWLQAPVRKGVGSNPTAVTLLARASGSDAAAFRRAEQTTGKPVLGDLVPHTINATQAKSGLLGWPCSLRERC